MMIFSGFPEQPSPVGTVFAEGVGVLKIAI